MLIERTKLIDTWFITDEECSHFTGYVSTRYLIERYPVTMKVGFGVDKSPASIKALIKTWQVED